MRSCLPGWSSAGSLSFIRGLFRIDSILSLIIAVVILFSTWQLLRDSLRLSLDGVPEGIQVKDIRSAICGMTGVVDFHHIHVWALSTTENALTAHLVVAHNTDMLTVEKLKDRVKHELLHQNIQHATLEIETEDVPCKEPNDC